MTFLNHLPTVLILLALAAVLFFAIRSVVRDRKKGGSCSCGCASCPMHCAGCAQSSSAEDGTEHEKTE